MLLGMMKPVRRITRHDLIPLFGVMLPLVALYLLTLQTIPNGSSHYYMIDVGETQIVLNNWGTLHATGYPLFVMLGNVITAVMRLVGIDALTASALVSLIWGVLALGIVYALAIHLTGRRWLAAGVMLALGLARTVWIHHVVAEIYTFGLLLQVALLALALWQGDVKGRIWWMALLGGVAVAHHRATVMMIPALLYAVWPVFRTNWNRLPHLISVSLLLGLLGFTQYAYLYLRARAGADWVYGQPGTLGGLWDEFIGKEAARFIGPPESFNALLANAELVTDVLIRDLTLPGVLVGVIGLILAIRRPEHRHSGVTLALTGGAAYLFHVVWYSDVLSALVLLVILALAFGWLYLGDAVLNLAMRPAYRRYALTGVLALLAGYLLTFNLPFIQQHTTDDTGQRTVQQVSRAPEGATVMLAWGPRYFAVSASQIFRDTLTHVTLVDDKVVFTQVDEPLVTMDYTFYNQPVSWWESRLGSPVYLRAVAPRIVHISTEPQRAENPPDGITVAEESVTCHEPNLVALNVLWQTGESPQRDLSVYVHGLNAADEMVAQGDQRAPVYGWRPLTDWLANEQVRDVYPLALDDGKRVQSIRYGMYRVLPEGGFENVSEHRVDVTCRP